MLAKALSPKPKAKPAEPKEPAPKKGRRKKKSDF